MSGKRKESLVTKEIYHVFNRSVANTDILVRKKELDRALQLFDYYRFPQELKFSRFKTFLSSEKEKYISEYKNKKPLVEIYTFSFMSDHYHFLLKQMVDNGIREFISNFQNAFAKYFNKKNQRSGSLFQQPFKAKRIESDEVFLHVSRYIHLNPVTSYVIEVDKLATYPGTSYPYYIGGKDSDLVNTGYLLKIIGSSRRYEEFVRNQVDYQRKLAFIKKFLLE